MEETKPTTIKSAIAAGLLGIFLGQFGAHDWYLGNKKNGLIHVILFAGSFVVILLSSVVAAVAVLGGIDFLAAIFGFFTAIAYLVMMGNGISKVSLFWSKVTPASLLRVTLLPLFQPLLLQPPLQPKPLQKLTPPRSPLPPRSQLPNPANNSDLSNTSL